MTGAPLALLTPMANPTVEREMRVLLPADCDYVTGRLVSSESYAMARLVAYAEELPETLAQFDTLALSGIAFACTGSSYLIGRDGEDRIAARLVIPVLWAARAIADHLVRLDAKHIVVISPYPTPLHEAGLGYWRDRGFEIAHEERVEIGGADTRAIYRLTGTEAAPAVERARARNPDAILLSGTGMPTAALLAPGGAPPVISSNWCLAQAMRAVRGN